MLSVRTELRRIEALVFADIEDRYNLYLSTILLVNTALQAFLISILPITYNDGLNLQVSRLINRGYEPYTQIFTLENPLFVWLLGWLGKFSLSPTGFKGVFLLFSLLLLVNISIIARYWLGEKTTLLTIFLLATAPTFLAKATAVAAVIPAMSIGTLSLVLSLFYLKLGKVYWPVLSGVVWGIALLFSTSALIIAAVTLLLIIFSPVNDTPNESIAMNWSKIYKPIGLWLIGAGISLGIGLLIATPNLVINHILANQASIRNNLLINQKTNFELVGRFITGNLWLGFFTLVGLSQLYKAPHHPLWMMVIWGLLSFCWLMLQVILQLVDLYILLPPLAVIAGWGLVEVAYYWKRSYKFKAGFSQARIGILLGLGLYLIISWSQFNNFILQDVGNEEEFIQFQRQDEIVQLIQQHTNVDDCVVIDDAALAIAANRLPAPQLAGLTEARFTGLITDVELRALVAENECRAVVFSNRKYTQPYVDFEDWVKSYFPYEQKLIRTTIYYK